jgi:hypothetical protein
MSALHSTAAVFHRYGGRSRNVQRRHARFDRQRVVRASLPVLEAVGALTLLSTGDRVCVGGSGAVGLGRSLALSLRARGASALRLGTFVSSAAAASRGLRTAAAALRGLRSPLFRGVASHSNSSLDTSGRAWPARSANRPTRLPGAAAAAPPRSAWTSDAASSASVRVGGRLPGSPPSSEGRARTMRRDERLLDSVVERLQQHVATSSRAAGQESRAAPVSGPLHAPSSNNFDGMILPYGDSPTALTLIAAKVSLPSDLSSVDLLTALPREPAALWAAPSPALLLDSADVPANLPKPHVFASRSEWVLLLRRLLTVDMIDLATKEPLVVNGAFGVRKDGDSLRLIIDARRCNAHFRRPDNPLLPTPAEIARLRVPAGRRLLVAKSDLSNCYHSLKVPLWLRQYFGLPAVTAGELGLAGFPPDTLLWPCLNRLAMGFAPAVLLAQQCTLRLMLDSGFRLSDLVLPGNVDFGLDRPRAIVYLDDCVWLGLEQHRARMLQQQARYVITGVRRGWLFHPAKLRLPDFVGEVLGLTLNGFRCTLGLDPLKMDIIAAQVRQLLGYSRACVRTVQSLLGKLVWSMLACRPALSCFRHVFIWLDKHVRAGVRYAALGPVASQELAVAAAILPLCRTDLASPFFSHVVATDASEVGFGVTACTPGVDIIAAASQRAGAASLAGDPAIAPYTMHPAVDSLLRLRWRTIVSSPVRVPAHIASLEATAATLGLRWALSTPSAVGSTILFLSDNSAVTCAIAKGRSSSFRLHQNICRFAALCLASGSIATVVWIPTSANPADSPSRLRV